MVVPHSSAESAQARARLVAALRKQGVIHSEPVAQAFLSVPREIFVTWFYEQQCQAPWAWEKRTPEDILDLQAVKHPIFPFYSKPENMSRKLGKRINFNPSIIGRSFSQAMMKSVILPSV